MDEVDQEETQAAFCAALNADQSTERLLGRTLEALTWQAMEVVMRLYYTRATLTWTSSFPGGSSGGR